MYRYNNNIYSDFYASFIKYLYRDEKSGWSIFSVKSKQCFPEKMYQEETRKVNGENEKWYIYTVSADAVSFYEKPMPLHLVGRFEKGRKDGQAPYFKVEDEIGVLEEVGDEVYAREYLQGYMSKTQAAAVVNTLGKEVFELKGEDDALKIKQCADITKERAEKILYQIQCTRMQGKLFSMMKDANVSMATCLKLIKKYGTTADREIKDNPYKVGNWLGLSFREQDSIAKSMQLSSSSVKRTVATVREVMDRVLANGHTYTTLEEFSNLYYRTGKQSAYKEVPDSLTFALMQTQSNVRSMTKPGEVHIFDENINIAEGRSVINLKRIIENSKPQPYSDELIAYAEKECNIHYGIEQRAAFRVILKQSGVSILTGGPGCGKTTTVNGIIKAWKKMFPEGKVKLCAPTGRAAQRMAESTEYPATTIHRLLDYRPFGSGVSHKDASDQIDADFIVVDEVSMLDSVLFDIFLAAVKTKTSILFVGDPDQLESVGPGAVLRDLLCAPNAAIHKIHLSEVYRQKGGSPIIENAIRIQNGETQLITCNDFQIIKCNEAKETLARVLQLSASLYNPKKPFETQILCPSKKGDSGVVKMNEELQGLLNPKIGREVRYGRTVFRVKDKIIMIRNNYEADYYNGDIGVVKAIKDGNLVVIIRDKEITLTRELMPDIKLAYAITIHKSQGSEFENAIVVMPASPRNMLVKNLFYTAITRAKKRVFVFDEQGSVDIAIQTDKSDYRQTKLLEYLSRELGAYRR